MSLDDVITPQPHLVPRYTGYVPQLKYRLGKTYGSLTHKILVDPTVNKSEKLIVTDRTTDEYDVLRALQSDIDQVEGRLKCGEAVYRHPIIPGYEGFVPRLRSHIGQRFSVSATEAVSEFERQQMRDRQALNLLHHRVSLQEGAHHPRSLQDRQLVESQFRMPLSVVRPEMAGIVRKVPVTEPYVAPPSHSTLPYFLHASHPDKYFMSGYTGHVPLARGRCGEGQPQQSRSALDDFTANQRWRQSTEWAPVSVVRPDPPVLLHHDAIYQRHLGLLPGYQGRNTGPLVHKLMNNIHNEEIKQKLKEFSLQLLHRRIHFTACGLFPLDFTVLLTMVGASTTYLLMLIQFQMSYGQQGRANTTSMH